MVSVNLKCHKATFIFIYALYIITIIYLPKLGYNAGTSDVMRVVLWLVVFILLVFFGYCVMTHYCL